MSLSLLFYCRAGFENDCASEIMEYANARGINGFVKAKLNSAHVIYQAHNSDEIVELWNDLQLNNFVFARQVLLSSDLLTKLPEQNRTVPIMEAFEKNFAHILANKKQLEDLFVEALDADEYKEVLIFCKNLQVPCSRNLKSMVIL